MVTVSIGVVKDTCKNVLDTKEFVVNIVSEPIAQAMNATSVDGPPEVNEWQVAGFTPIPSVSFILHVASWVPHIDIQETVKPARIAESAFSLECTLHHSVPIGENHMVLFVGHVRRIHARNAVLAEDGKTVDWSKLMPVNRLGGNNYASLGNVYEIPRPAWKEKGEEITEKINKTENKY
jgi:flavin reductase (DIM6/NTAB) family NADH-FMN oxidoreductase RutF